MYGNAWGGGFPEREKDWGGAKHTREKEGTFWLMHIPCISSHDLSAWEQASVLVFLNTDTTIHQFISHLLRWPRPCTGGCVGWWRQTGMGSGARRPFHGLFYDGGSLTAFECNSGAASVAARGQKRDTHLLRTEGGHVRARGLDN